jgi:general stress protein 26
MRYLIVLWFFLAVSCQNEPEHKQLRTDFTEQEQHLLQLSRDIIDQAYLATFITMDRDKPHPRIMEPFAPGKEWIIWMGTNSRSRKVKEIEKNPVATLHYFDKSAPAYVNFYGKAYIVNDKTLKDSIWRQSWKDFYPGKSYYTLIKFVPDSLEMIYPAKGLPGDTVTWKPYGVVLRK